MSGAILAAVSAMFRDRNLAVDGHFDTAAGTSTAVRVIFRAPDETVLFPTVGLNTPARIAEIEKSKVSVEPVEGDALVIDDDQARYPVLSARTPDQNRHIWQLSLGRPS